MASMENDAGWVVLTHAVLSMHRDSARAAVDEIDSGAEVAVVPPGTLVALAVHKHMEAMSLEEVTARHDRAQADLRTQATFGDTASLFARYRFVGRMAHVEWPGGSPLLTYDLDRRTICEIFPPTWHPGA
jgi:hypothetical protein